VDTAPDKDVHKVIDGLFIGSQDAALNEEALRENAITHVLTVATGINVLGLEVFFFLLPSFFFLFLLFLSPPCSPSHKNSWEL